MKSRSPWRMLSSAVAGIALIGGSLALGAPAAQAATTLSGPTNAAISQQVTYKLTQAPMGSLVLQDQNGQGYAYQTVLTGAPTVYFTFVTPTTASTLVLSVYDQGSSTPIGANSVTLSVGSIVGTTTTISAPNTSIVGQPVTITATVTSNDGSQYTPPGQVRITDANNATISTLGLTPGPAVGQSYAYFRYTPKTAGTYIFIATYVPSGGSLAAASTSIQDTLIATPSGSTISISAPPTLSVGTPVNLVATVYPAGTQGSVGFTVNGAPISASIPITNGTASFTWTPPAAGQITLGASYTTNNGGSGSTSEVVTVGAPTAADVITLVQPGWGAWGNGGSYNMGNGSNFTFQASTLSGAPVTLSETGPCVVSGLNLQVNQGSGACTMKATSPGGNGYAGVTYTYNINLVPGVQTATLSAPVSGRYKVGRVLVLESPGQQDTNAGQNINWKIKKGGKSVCQLLYPNNGSVTLKIKKKGSCTVLGTAPGVAGQWLKFSTARNYTGR